MADKVLVAYGSKYGATREIAEKIGEELKKAGLGADIVSADKVKDLAPYKDVIIGTAVYMGNGRKEVTGFLKRNIAALQQKRVWCFASGPSGKGDPVQLVKGERVPVNMKHYMVAINPKEAVVFHGDLSPERMKGWEKWIVKRVGGETGDFRDWDMITGWAKKVAEEIKN